MRYYSCTYCKKEFEFPEAILFCPFCGMEIYNRETGECSELDETAVQYRKAWKRDMDVLEVELFGDITKGLDAIRNEIENYTQMMIAKALREIHVKEETPLAYDFFDAMSNCLEAQSLEVFFKTANHALEDLEKLMQKSQKLDSDAVNIIEFGKFYDVLGRMDETFSEVLKCFRKVPYADLPERLEPFSIMRFDVEAVGENISQELCVNVLMLLKKLLTKLQCYAEKNHLYFNYFGETGIVCKKFEKNAKKTETMLIEAVRRELVYDILEENDTYEELLSIFWNGFYQLSVYIGNSVKLEYLYNGEHCEPKCLIENKLKKHYRMIFMILMSVEWAMKKEGPWAIRGYLLDEVQPIFYAAREREKISAERERKQDNSNVDNGEENEKIIVEHSVTRLVLGE